jgi:hypothetical protein
MLPQCQLSTDIPVRRIDGASSQLKSSGRRNLRLHKADDGHRADVGFSVLGFSLTELEYEKFRASTQWRTTTEKLERVPHFV